jgi:hypothetical protein
MRAIQRPATRYWSSVCVREREQPLSHPQNAAGMHTHGCGVACTFLHMHTRQLPAYCIVLAASEITMCCGIAAAAGSCRTLVLATA